MSWTQARAGGCLPIRAHELMSYHMPMDLQDLMLEMLCSVCVVASISPFLFYEIRMFRFAVMVFFVFV